LHLDHVHLSVLAHPTAYQAAGCARHDALGLW
jgi:hypothetical protein